MSFWRAVDWQRPWLAPYRAAGEAVCHGLEQGRSVAQALDALAPHGMRFVAATELPAGEAYEMFIARCACVPTRDNLHDLFNGVVWLRFPALKRRLNQMQAAEIARCGVSGTRGALRDALTLFDENAALWQAPAALVEALRQRDWQRLFVTHRALWPQARRTLFGHALLEKLVQPRKAITAHLWWGAADERCAPGFGELLHPQALCTRSHLPLPVLGVPGWWPANEAPGFYADVSVFRPPRAG